jgi:serine/threonine protein kinase
VSDAIAECAAQFASLSITVDAAHLTVEQQIGAGAFATVFRARIAAAAAGEVSQLVAVKQLTPNGMYLPAQAVASFQREVSLMARLRHENVVGLVGAFAQRGGAPSPAWAQAPGCGCVCLVSEFCARGDLFTLLADRARVPDASFGWGRRLGLALDGARGLAFLHAQDVIHRDLKSLNLLLTADWRLKISDFGLSRFKAASSAAVLTGQCGSFHWMAPEIMDGSAYSEKADVYSFGVNLWEFFTRQVPFNGLPVVQVVAAVITRQERPPIPAACPAPYAQLVRDCWQSDDAARPSMDEVCARLQQLLAHV